MRPFDPDSYPFLLPHLGLAADGVHLGGLRLGAWPEAALAFARTCDGRTALREIPARREPGELPPELLDHLLWLERPLGPPAGAAAEEGCERVLVLSPHPQTAFLSIGGFLTRHAGRLRCTCVSCFSQVVETVLPEAFAGAGDVSSIRRDETVLCARILGCETRFLDYPAHEIRALLFPEERRERRELGLRRALTLSLYELIAGSGATRVFAPAGMGEHPDHRVPFEIVLDFFKQGWFPEIRFHFYEDFPASVDYLHVDDFLSRFERAYAELEEWTEEVSGAAAGRRLLAEVYRSLLSPAERRDVERPALRNPLVAPAGRPGSPRPRALERFWTLNELPARAARTAPAA